MNGVKESLEEGIYIYIRRVERFKRLAVAWGVAVEELYKIYVYVYVYIIFFFRERKR